MDEDIILKWTPSENATSYGVYVAKEPYGPRNLIYDLEGITGNSLNIGILPAGKYCFNMQAMNDAGASPFSNVTYFTVVKAPQEQKKTLNLKINDVYKRNSIVYVPIRYVAESLGSNVSWDNNTQSIVIQKGLDAIVFQIGSKKTYMQGIKNLDVATVIVNGKSYISIDSLSKIFGIEVKWNDKTNTLSIDYEELSNEKIIKDFLNFINSFLFIVVLFSTGLTPT